jgi:hypothetical protein
MYIDKKKTKTLILSRENIKLEYPFNWSYSYGLHTSIHNKIVAEIQFYPIYDIDKENNENYNENEKENDKKENYNKENNSLENDNKENNIKKNDNKENFNKENNSLENDNKEKKNILPTTISFSYFENITNKKDIKEIIEDYLNLIKIFLINVTSKKEKVESFTFSEYTHIRDIDFIYLNENMKLYIMSLIYNNFYYQFTYFGKEKVFN